MTSIPTNVKHRVRTTGSEHQCQNSISEPDHFFIRYARTIWYFRWWESKYPVKHAQFCSTFLPMEAQLGWEGLLIFKEQRSTANYLRGAGEQAHTFGDLGSTAKNRYISGFHFIWLWNFACFWGCRPDPPLNMPYIWIQFISNFSSCAFKILYGF